MTIRWDGGERTYDSTTGHELTVQASDHWMTVTFIKDGREEQEVYRPASYRNFRFDVKLLLVMQPES